MRIAICGPSGAGKTTLAKYISEKHGIPYRFTDGVALREKYGFQSHKDIIKACITDPGLGVQYQKELFDERASKSLHEHYVMDRSPLDNIAYFLMQLSPMVSDAVTNDYLEKAKLVARNNVDLYILIPPQAFPEDDGVRVQNSYYQKMSWEMMKYAYSLTFGVDKEGVDLVEYDEKGDYYFTFLFGRTPKHIGVLTLLKWDLEQRKRLVDLAIAQVGKLI
jgi:nicotinamide riboside kinase